MLAPTVLCADYTSTLYRNASRLTSLFVVITLLIAADVRLIVVVNLLTIVRYAQYR